MAMKDQIPSGTGRVMRVINTLGLWAAVLGGVVVVWQGGLAYGRQQLKIETLQERLTSETAVLRDDVDQSVTILRAGILSLGDAIGKIQVVAARDDERIRQIKEDTDEIKQDIKTLIRTIQNDRRN